MNCTLIHSWETRPTKTKESEQTSAHSTCAQRQPTANTHSSHQFAKSHISHPQGTTQSQYISTTGTSSGPCSMAPLTATTFDTKHSSTPPHPFPPDKKKSLASSTPISRVLSVTTEIRTVLQAGGSIVP